MKSIEQPICFADLKVGDFILFKFYTPNYEDKCMDIKEVEAEILSVWISPMPDHIPSKVGVEVYGESYGIRLEEIVEHRPIEKGQLSLFNGQI